MTICDTNIPFTKVLMVLPRNTIHTETPLHEGYTYAPWRESFRQPWAALMVETGLVPDQEAGLAQWDKMMNEAPEMLREHFRFVLGPEGDLAATAGLFPGHDFPDRLRLHWVATGLNHQHRGLAKSIITALAKEYDRMPEKYPLYLSTQSQSYGAIKLYSRLGFQPYMGEYAGHTKEQSEDDWRIVTGVLQETEGK
ncbi:GNAT family N-acetyltransferase [Faecalibaculum rodentium]|uniref:GNAT family N-acetyltransferase n=1 Tax=Faecalibaculum rodentium TaxID=1702221 RepID=UPI00263A7877|nr:GNAT family N-acetyltransferase [Faecalibaculum rodentium]